MPALRMPAMMLEYGLASGSPTAVLSPNRLYLGVQGCNISDEVTGHYWLWEAR